MPATVTVLRAVRESGSTWHGFMSALPDRPGKGERSAMRELQSSIGALEAMELIQVERGRNNEVASISLTELGQERLSEAEEEAAAPREGRRLL